MFAWLSLLATERHCRSATTVFKSYSSITATKHRLKVENTAPAVGPSLVLGMAGLALSLDRFFLVSWLVDAKNNGSETEHWMGKHLLRLTACACGHDIFFFWPRDS